MLQTCIFEIRRMRSIKILNNNEGVLFKKYYYLRVTKYYRNKKLIYFSLRTLLGFKTDSWQINGTINKLFLQ